MGFTTWLKSLRTKKETINNIEYLPIFRSESPEKIVETRIKPIKIPTIVDIGDRLGTISRNISELRGEIISKSWFKTEYEDVGNQVICRLINIEDSLNTLHSVLDQITKDLSNFTKKVTKPELSKYLSYTLTDKSVQILTFLKESERCRFKDLSLKLNMSDPTLSKHLKTLCKDNKIKREKLGKAVYYELIEQTPNSL